VNIGLQDSFFHDNKKNHAHDEGFGIALTNPIPEVYEIIGIISAGGIEPTGDPAEKE
jgi:hypothetical protein